MADHPFDVIVKAITEHAANGDVCFLKFTCGKCGTRLTIEEPNTIYKMGECISCGHVTDITKSGANYILLRGLTPEGREQIKRMFDDEIRRGIGRSS